MTPMALEVSLAVWQEIQERQQEADRLRRQQVERAHYEAELARRRYLQVDPSNRLVADSLEADWNERLRLLAEAKERYEQQQLADQSLAKQIDRERVMSLVHDLPALWNDPKTPSRERKRMLGLLIEDVTLIKREQIIGHVRFRGGATRTLTLPLPLNAWQGRTTSPAVVTEIDALLEHHTDGEVSRILNQRGLETGAGAPFSSQSIRWVRHAAGLKSLKQRLSAAGWLTTQEFSAKLGVHYSTLKEWRRKGLIHGRPCRDGGAPGSSIRPNTIRHRSRRASPSHHSRIIHIWPNPQQEVQCETKSYQVDPLVCSRCGEKMQMIAFLTDQLSIRRVLDHLGLSPSAQAKPPPTREILRVAEHGEGWGVPADWQ